MLAGAMPGCSNYYGKSPHNLARGWTNCWCQLRTLPSRRIALFNCTTHNAKASRNALYNSAPSRARKFIYDGVPFGWEQINQCYERDVARNVTETHLTIDAVCPDKWQKMNVSLCKRVFEYGTITEMMTHLATELGCVGELVRKKGESNYSVIDFYERQLPILKEKVRERQDCPLQIKQQLACTEYCIHVGIIYNETLQNSNVNFTLENIDAQEAKLREQLKYFHDWKIDGNSRKDMEGWDRWTIHRDTWLNMRMGVCGFLQYV